MKPCPQVIDHPGFGSLFMLLIVANTVLLAMTTAGGSQLGAREPGFVPAAAGPS